MSELKVTIQNRNLSGSDRDGILQRIATAHIPESRDEYRIFAPAKAKGDALEWVDHFIVYQHYSIGRTHEIYESNRLLVIRAVKAELEKLHQNKSHTTGINPHGTHYTAHICLQGHVLSSGRQAFTAGEHCPRCGSPSIDACQHCNTAIRGVHVRASVDAYHLPSFCHKCGHPFPWMEDKLATARELLYHDDKLSLDDRTQLWNLLKYVMTDPMSDLAPSKRKLINIRLEKAASFTREFVLDLMAKITAETFKG